MGSAECPHCLRLFTPDIDEDEIAADSTIGLTCPHCNKKFESETYYQLCFINEREIE
jgi:hypothetical protein